MSTEVEGLSFPEPGVPAQHMTIDVKDNKLITEAVDPSKKSRKDFESDEEYQAWFNDQLEQTRQAVNEAFKKDADRAQSVMARVIHSIQRVHMTQEEANEIGDQLSGWTGPWSASKLIGGSGWVVACEKRGVDRFPVTFKTPQAADRVATLLNNDRGQNHPDVLAVIGAESRWVSIIESLPEGTLRELRDLAKVLRIAL